MADYEESMFGTPGGAIISDIEIKATLNYLKPVDGEKILEVGTGTGRIARNVVNSGADLIGIDKDYKMLKHAYSRKKNLKDSNKYHLIVADGHFLPFRESSFDSVVCIRVLKYFFDYKRGIKEMTRVLKHEGKFVLELSNIFSWVTLARVFGLNLGYPHLFRFKAMKKILLQNNLGLIHSLHLHKVYPIVWTWFKNPLLLHLLKATEEVLQKATPKELFSRGILVKCIKGLKKE